MVCINFGLIVRLINSIGYFAWNDIYNHNTDDFLYVESYTMWIVGWIFVIGLWADLSSGSGIEKNLTNAPLIIAIVGSIFFVGFETLCFLLLLVGGTYRNSLINALNGILAFVIFSGLILIPIFSSRVLSKLQAFESRNQHKVFAKLIRKTKIIRFSAFIFGVLLVDIIVFTILQDLIDPEFTILEEILFQLSFRFLEIPILCCIILLSTGTSVTKTFMVCIKGKGDSRKTSTDATKENKTEV